VIRRLFKNLGVLDATGAPEASVQLERDGYALLPGVFGAAAIAEMRREVDEVFETYPAERVRGDKNEFRYEMFNRSAACQAAMMHPATLAVVEPLLGDDCHVIANTAWRNPAEFPGGPWHCDAGPHVPRPADVPWDDRIPYPIFAVATHIYLQDCALADGPTAVVPGSHRSGRLAPFDLMQRDDISYDGRPPVVLEAAAGDVVLFVSDAWHRGVPARPGGRGRYFLQVHYGRRDIAQRVRLTDDVHHASPEAAARATTDRARSLIGLHAPFFYDA
jgi:ectoine hydroxylase-related dioxygenase (phytanoyl-CoA dioxygenase family)